MVRQIGDAGAVEGRMEGPQQLQRIDDAVVRRPDRAGHVLAQARHQRGRLVMVEQLPLVGLDARLRHQRADPLVAGLDLVVAHQRRQTALLLQRDIDARFLQQLRGQARPEAGRAQRPAAVGPHAMALALQPDQAEVAARGAQGDIALVEHGDRADAVTQAIGDRRADQAAADHGDVEDGGGGVGGGHQRGLRREGGRGPERRTVMGGGVGWAAEPGGSGVPDGAAPPAPAQIRVRAASMRNPYGPQPPIAAVSLAMTSSTRALKRSTRALAGRLRASSR